MNNQTSDDKINDKIKFLLPCVIIACFVLPILLILFREYQISKLLEIKDFWSFFAQRYQSGVFVFMDIMIIGALLGCIFLTIKYHNKIRFSRMFVEMSTASNVPLLILREDKSIYWTNINNLDILTKEDSMRIYNEIISTDDCKTKFENCMKTGVIETFEIETKIMQNSAWLHITLSKLKNKRLNNMICATVSNISNLKEASEKIDNQQRELKMQNDMLTLITAQMEVQQAGIKEQNELLSVQHKQLEEQAEELKNAFKELEISNKQIITKTNYITDSIKYAQTIQEAMLPDEDQMENFFHNFVIYKPKDIVSGDFYWMSINDDYTYAVLGDCTGHGVPGAFMSMIGIRLLGELINESKIDRPSVILEAMHERIQAALKQDVTENNDGMDIAICRFKKVTGEDYEWELKYAGAKQPIYIKRKDGNDVEMVDADRRGIGGQSYADVFFFEDRDIHLKNGDRIYLTSDGIKDQNNINRKRFGTARLKMMLSFTSTQKIEEQKMFIDTILNNWQGLEEQRDDISLWGIELGEPEE